MSSPSPTTYEAKGIEQLGATRSGIIQLRREWPVPDPKAIVLLVHGMSEHSGRYEHFAQYLNDHGFGVVSFDHRGHGQTGGRRAWIAHFDDFVDDVEDHLAEIRKIDVPAIIIGHSMGGLISLSHAVSNRPQPDLLVVSGPPLAGLDPAGKLDPLPPIAAPLLGGFRMDSGLPSSVLSQDEAVCQAYDDDPLIDTGATIDMLAAMVKCMEHTRDNLHKVRVPVLAMAGEQDELVPPKSTHLLEGRQGFDTIFYDDLRHEIFNETVWQEVADDVIRWLDSRLS